MFNFPSYAAFEIIILIFLFFVLGYYSFSGKKRMLTLKTVFLVGLASLVLTLASLMVQDIHSGGTLFSRVLGWPHNYLMQTSQKEFSYDFKDARINFQASYALCDLLFYSSLIYLISGLAYLWKNNSKQKFGKVTVFVIVVIGISFGLVLQTQKQEIPQSLPSIPNLSAHVAESIYADRLQTKNMLNATVTLNAPSFMAVYQYSPSKKWQYLVSNYFPAGQQVGTSKLLAVGQQEEVEVALKPSLREQGDVFEAYLYADNGDGIFNPVDDHLIGDPFYSVRFGLD